MATQFAQPVTDDAEVQLRSCHCHTREHDSYYRMGDVYMEQVGDEIRAG